MTQKVRDPRSSVVCLGFVGGNADLLKRAEAVNLAKAAFKAVCAPLQKISTWMPVKGSGGGTKAIPVIRVVLRGIQRSDVNLLAAYRKRPILDAPPLSVTYTRARTRAVYRKSIEEVYNLLINNRRAPINCGLIQSYDNVPAALSRNRGETSITLMNRLDCADDLANNHDTPLRRNQSSEANMVRSGGYPKSA